MKVKFLPYMLAPTIGRLLSIPTSLKGGPEEQGRGIFSKSTKLSIVHLFFHFVWIRNGQK